MRSAAVEQDHFPRMHFKPFAVVLKKHPSAVDNGKHIIVELVAVDGIGMIAKVVPDIGCVNQRRPRKL